MAKTISKNSRSFLRFIRYSQSIGYSQEFSYLFQMFYNSKKSKNKTLKVKDVRDWLLKKKKDEREVFYAENLNNKNEHELQEIRRELAEHINNRLLSSDLTMKQKEEFAGVIELHPTKIYSDNTSKNAHIHYWGEYSDLIRVYINEYIEKTNLSNKNKKDFAYGYMENGVVYYRTIKPNQPDSYYFEVFEDGQGKKIYSIEETDEGVIFRNDEEIEIKEAEVIEIEEVGKKFKISTEDLLRDVNDLLDDLNDELLSIKEMLSSILDVDVSLDVKKEDVKNFDNYKNEIDNIIKYLQ